ncbi:MAG: hypothetical protein KAQ98_02140, partial [Bacteriovoracaceae bacterium]|nr:hypothetical protein [Bacteriovoracaceae bacterium]
MNILIYLIFSVLFAPGVFASIFTVVDVGLECDFSDGCERFEKNINEFVDQEYTRESFREKIRVIPLDESIDGFSYRLNIRANKTAELVIRIRPRVKIQKIVFKSNYNIDFAQLEKFFLYKEGDYYHSWKMPDAYKEIRKYFNERGFEVRNIQVMREERGGDIDLTFGIDIVHVKIINKIDIVCENNGLKEELYKRFLKLRGSVWDKLKIKVEIGGISKELYERGYFQSKVSDITSSIQEESHITLRIKVQTGEKYNFHFRGNNVIARSELLSNIKFYIRNNLGKFNEDELNKVIVAIYEKRGIYNTDVKIGKRFGINKYNISFNNLYFKIIEGTKIPIEEIRFTGNEKLDNRILEKIYNDNATPIASGGYLDQDYLDEYPALLKKAYLERGYVFINSSKPKIIFSEKFNKAIVEYRIRERQRTKLGKIIIKNIEDEIISQIKKVMKNKENSYLNLVAIQDDLNTIIQIIQNQGYYFAEILNQDRGELLSYDTGYLNATLNVDVRTGKKIIFNEVIVTGNEKTKTEVITRLLRIKKDEKITRKNVQQMKKDISYLGLFSTIKITPYIRKQREGTDEYYANLLIQVKERNFGVVEVAPGFRTDIGMKISGAVAYNNLMGMNRSAMFKVQANSRLDYNNFDERRRMERKRVIEYSVKT